MGNEKPRRSCRKVIAAWARKENVRDNAIVSALTALALVVLSALGTLALSATSTIDFNDSLPVWLFVGAVAAGALAGGVGGAFIARVFYFRRRVNRAEWRRKEVKDLLRRSLLYSHHIKSLLKALQEGRENARQSILEYAAETFKEAIGDEVCLSICTKGPDGLRLEAAPHHNDIERRAFEVPHNASWLIFTWGRTPPEDEGRLLGVTDLKTMEATNSGDDLKAMVKHGHRCLKVAAIDGGERCLIALSKQPDAFSDEDLVYLEFLALVLGLDQSS